MRVDRHRPGAAAHELAARGPAFFTYHARPGRPLDPFALYGQQRRRSPEQTARTLGLAGTIG